MSSARPSLIAWVLLAVLLVAAFAVWNTHRFEFDDAYISYRYATNLVSGEGLVFNPGERVEGYSNFLWVLVLAVGGALGAPPHLLAPWLGVAAYLTIVALCWMAIWLPRFGFRLDSAQRVLVSSALLILVTTDGLGATAGSGLESHFFALLILAGGVALGNADLQTTPSLIALGTIPALLVLTRPDGVVPGAAMILVVILRSSKERSDWRIGLLSGAIAAVPATVAGLAYAAFKTWYFGSLLPNPYYAKGADSLHLDAGFAYIFAFLRSYPFVAVSALLLIPLVFRRSTTEAGSRIAAYSLVTLVVYSLFLIKVGGDFMEYRLALQMAPMVIFAGAIAAVGLSPTRWIQIGLIVVLIGLSLRSPVMESKFYMQTLEEMNGYTEVGSRVGRSLAHLPPHTRIATTLIGTIGYFSDLHIIDQWGLVDPRVRHRPPRPNFFRGHVRHTDLVESRKLGAHLFLGHPHLCRCSPGCIRSQNHVLIATERDECVRAQVLEPDPVLIEALCSDPIRFPATGQAVCRSFRKSQVLVAPSNSSAADPQESNNADR